MVDEIPGFAGMYIAPTGEFVVRVASGAEPTMEPPRDAVTAEFPSVSAMTMKVEQAEQDYVALNSWKRAVGPVLALDGVQSLDLDERRGKIVLGALDSAARDRALAAALGAGVPGDVVEVVIEEPVRLAHGSAGSEASLLHTLSSWFRPLRAGFRMAYGSESFQQCTLGFLAKIDESGEERVALVNSHCTALLAASDAGDIYQSTWGTSGHLFGTEARDPAPFACPENPDHGCRNSDAALVRLGASVDWDFPYIARSTGSDPFSGSTRISHSSPRFKVVSEGPVFMGMTLSKIGRVTGWTTGTVSATCMNVEPDEPDAFTVLCNGEVQAGVAGGDSGSPVFRELGDVEGEPTVALHGLLWGQIVGSATFFFSQTQYIREDLGLFTTFDDQSVPSPS